MEENKGQVCCSGMLKKTLMSSLQVDFP